MLGNARAHAQNPRARADWYSGHTGATGTAKIAPRSLWRGIRVFSAISTYTDILRLLSNEPSLVFACTYAPRRTPYTRMLSRVEARTVYKYNETCEPHNIIAVLSYSGYRLTVYTSSEE